MNGCAMLRFECIMYNHHHLVAFVSPGVEIGIWALSGTWSEKDQVWLESLYGGTERFRAVAYREFSRGAGYFTM
eukprot:scaffold241178_cov42-Cyclotella_meneghiniana.AAC.1